MQILGKKKIYLTLDLEKDYGTALKEDFFFSLQKAKPLIIFLEKNNIPLTIFIQTKILELEKLPEYFFSEKIRIEFEVHSYSHRLRSEISNEEEIKKSTELFKSYFKKPPKGYRAPDGNIRWRDIELLLKYNYEYDSSIFPIWRPNRFNNLLSRRKAFFLTKNFLEIPFTTFNKKIPIPISLSYFKFLGKYYENLCLLFSKNNRIVFDFHLHDLFPPKQSFEILPLHYKLIYRRNFSKGFEFFKKFVLFKKKIGFTFDNLENYANEMKKVFSDNKLEL